MSNNLLFETLALEYLKANHDLKTLSVEEYYQTYNKIYNELIELDSTRKSEISKSILNNWQY